MWILIAEALLALGLFVFIVWWTMFSGRKPDQRGQRNQQARSKDESGK